MLRRFLIAVITVITGVTVVTLAARGVAGGTCEVAGCDGLAGGSLFPADLPGATGVGPWGGPGEDADVVRTSGYDLRGHDGGGSDETCRLYASKILAISFENVKTTAIVPGAPAGLSPVWNSATSNNASSFTAAIVGGLWVPRDFGAIRLECEGALRDNFNQAANPENQTALNVRANDNWTALANVWRDIPLTRRLGAYAGGGVGGGGYWLEVTGPDGSVASGQSAVFVWQAGGGAIWKYNTLIDLDLSYRFVDFGSVTATVDQPGVGPRGTISSKLVAGEVFFMLRVYDPFQWRKHLVNPAFYLPE